MDDELRAELDAIDGDQLKREVDNDKAGRANAAYDLALYRAYRMSGMGPLAATVLVAIHAARD